MGGRRDEFDFMGAEEDELLSKCLATGFMTSSAGH